MAKQMKNEALEFGGLLDSIRGDGRRNARLTSGHGSGPVVTAAASDLTSDCDASSELPAERYITQLEMRVAHGGDAVIFLQRGDGDFETYGPHAEGLARELRGFVLIYRECLGETVATISIPQLFVDALVKGLVEAGRTCVVMHQVADAEDGAEAPPGVTRVCRPRSKRLEAQDVIDAAIAQLPAHIARVCRAMLASRGRTNRRLSGAIISWINAYCSVSDKHRFTFGSPSLPEVDELEAVLGALANFSESERKAIVVHLQRVAKKRLGEDDAAEMDRSLGDGPDDEGGDGD